jgi:hypothetical protein
MADIQTDNITTQEARTARLLAIALSCLLGATVIIQYSVLAALTLRGHDTAVPVFEHLFNSWLPVISGLSGSAVTYYLTKRPHVSPRGRPKP